MKKCFWGILVLSFLMLFSSVGVSAEAWTGKVDTEWYKAEESSFSLKSPEELAGLAAIVNGTAEDIEQDNFSGKTITLAANLDLGGSFTGGVWDNSKVSWTPIGTNVTPFAGIFDGNGYNISNLYIKSTGKYQGLFGSVSGKVKNLNITSGFVYGAGYLGGITGYLDKGALILNCSNNATVSGTTSSTLCGGIAGGAAMGGQSYVVNCYNSADISGASYIGGIAGRYGCYLNCYNTGDIYASMTRSNGSYCGGIANGSYSSDTFENCYNLGDVSAKNSKYKGGIAATANGTFKNCYSLKTDTVNTSVYATSAGDLEGAVSKNEAEMKSIASDLGSGYLADTENINNGYPILKWQKKVDDKYNYDPDESEGLDISSEGILEETAGGFKVKMNRLLQYTSLEVSDFTVTATENNTSVEISNLTIEVSSDESNTIVTFNFDKFRANVSVKYTVQYQSGSEYEKSFTTPNTDQWNDYSAYSFSSGDGSALNPYIIETAEELAFLGRTSSSNNGYANKFFKLANDMDLSARYWTPISQFKGFFNGNNKTISGLKTVDSSYGGLFDAVNNVQNSEYVAVIENLHFKDCNTFRGTLANMVGCVRISNCTVNGGTVSGKGTNDSYSGGLIAQINTAYANTSTIIDRCYSTATVENSAIVGGLVGAINGGNDPKPVYITDCWTGGTVVTNETGTYTSYSGGIVGSVQTKAYGIVMTNCFSTADVSGRSKLVGGLIGNVEISGQNAIFGKISITHSAALGSALTSTDVQAAGGRIVGNGDAVAASEKGTFGNNYALDTMTVLGKIVTEDESTASSAITQDTLSTKAFWENELFFDFSEEGAWEWTKDSVESAHPFLKADLFSDESALYLSMEPRDATKYSTVPAAFAVAAAGGALGYTYEWYVSTDDGKTWSDEPIGDSDTLTIDDKIYESGTRFRCVVADQAGQMVTSEAAVLTVTSAKYKPEDAVKDLESYYDENGVINRAKVAFGLATVKDDFSEMTVDTHFWLDYSGRFNGLGRADSAFPFSMMDNYALGIDPTRLTQTGDGQVRVSNLLNTILRAQDEQTGNIYYNFSYYPIYEEDLPVIILGLEMYFDGGEWGNEKEGTKLGRDGAIEYFFTKSLVEHEKSGGLELEYSDTVDGTRDRDSSNIKIQRSLAEAAILAARLVDDPKWGDQAEEALSGLMKTLEYLYDTRDETEGVTAFVYTESLARYVSALIAAGNATDNWFKQTAYFNLADEIVKEQLLPAKCIDGSYYAIAGESSVSGDADATAAVMMALGDYENQSSILMDYVFDIPDESAAANDLAEIEINSPVTADLELPVSGLYGSEITWETSDKNIISAAGKVNRGAEDKTVTLTATATKGEAVASRSFELVVKADADAATDAIDAVLAGLSVPIETIHDIALGVSADDSVTLTWTSSDETVLASDGTVVRPAVGERDKEVTLTATAVQGEVSKTKEFTVKVYAETGDSLQEAYYLTRDKYLNDKSISGYWEVWAAYAALGDYITDPANGYSVSINPPSSDWYGTQYGASVNAIVAMGENPYDYLDKNWVELLQKNYGGPFAGPAFSELGMEAAGASSDYYTPSAAAGISATTQESLAPGIDIAGWATVILAAHHNDGIAENEDVKNSSEFIINHLKNERGISETGNFGNVNFISTGCGIMGMAALYSVGYEEADVTTWANETTGKTPVDAVYDQCFLRNEYYIPNYDEQIEIAVCDLYNAKYNGGTSAWISCRVSAEKLEAQKAKAAEILENRDLYEAESIEAIETALETVNGISEERLSKSIADYGEEYYALYDAVRYAQRIGQAEKDAEAAAAVSEQLNALVNAESITLDDKSAVEAARAAYDALTEDQQAAVDAKAVQRLTEAEAKIEALSGKELGDISKFTDVKEGDWFYDSVDYVVSNGVFYGTSATTFSPQDPMTRAMFITVVGRHAGVKDSDSASPVYAYFDDVVSGQYYASHVKWGVDNGVTLGIGGGLFGTNNSITRQDMATMMVRYAKVIGMNLPEADGTLFADDGEISDYAKDAVYRLKAAGILYGRENNVFDPKATCTRAEVAAVLQRFMTHKDTVVMTMEKFTLGQGYVIEPMLVEVEEGDTAADVFMRAAKEKGMEYRCSYSSGTFYLGAVKDNDTGEAVIPQYILDAAGGEVSGRNTENWLGEFDYNGTAGWMIIVNNKKPTDTNGFELGAGQTEVKPGDVIRWMFTVVGLGRDLGIDQIASNNLITAADKDALTAAVAKADSKTKDSDAYKAALQVLMNLQASQAEVDAALDALK